VKELFAQMERTMRSEFMRMKLSHRQQNLATIIAEQSFGRGNQEVCIPTLGVFGDLTGFPKGAICEALQGLLNMRIIEVEKKPIGPVYRINTETEKWHVAPRRMPIQVQRAQVLIQKFNSGPEDRPVVLKELLAELSGYLTEQKTDGDAENIDRGAGDDESRVIILDSGMALETERADLD
jgi:hypothetical protein